LWNNENIIKYYIINIFVVWGGFSVNSATINRFFSLHFTLPFILAALVAGHLLYLHISGSSNPMGTTGNADRTPFHPYFSFKDLVTVYLLILVFALIIFYIPDKLGYWMAPTILMYSMNYNIKCLEIFKFFRKKLISRILFYRDHFKSLLIRSLCNDNKKESSEITHVDTSNFKLTKKNYEKNNFVYWFAGLRDGDGS